MPFSQIAATINEAFQTGFVLKAEELCALPFGLPSTLEFNYFRWHTYFDLYLLAPGFSPAQSLYHIDRVSGIWAEDKLQLYHNHLDAVLYLRLPALLLLKRKPNLRLFSRAPEPTKSRRSKLCANSPDSA